MTMTMKDTVFKDLMPRSSLIFSDVSGEYSGSIFRDKYRGSMLFRGHMASYLRREQIFVSKPV